MLIMLVLLLPLSALAYTLWHVWCLLPLSDAWRTVVVVLCAMSFLLIFMGMSHVIDRMPMRIATAVYEIGTSSLVVMLYTTLTFLLLDVLRLVRLIPPQALRDNAHMTVALVVVLVALFTYGNIHYHHKVRQQITLTTNKSVGREVRMLMISDLHLGYHIRTDELRQWVEMINAENPDIILIAGDIVDRSMRPVFQENLAAELRHLKAPVYACLGNHEYYCGVPEVMSFFHDAGITVLRDSVAVYDNINIVGRDDRTNPNRMTVEALTKDLDHSNYTILLEHQPFNIEQTARQGVDFQFSGHTHHGQVFPISLATDAIYTVAHGQYRIGATQFYVSSGLGIWGGKYRIGTCSEYVVATLLCN